MPEPQSQPPFRSLHEWSFCYRRRNVLRAIRHPSLSPAAKQILVALSLRDDDPFVLPERPAVGALARHLALAERTVRQALAELVVQGCVTFRATGESYRLGEGAPADPPDSPDARPDLARERAFLRAAAALPSRAEHLDMMARLRDRAVAARRIATAVSAERALGRALGIGRSAKQRARGTDAPLAAAAQNHDATETSLGPPHDELAGVDAVNVDRALAPAARHALIELLLDPVEDPMARPDDDHLRWSERLAVRLGVTVRGARKALAELEDRRLIAQARGDVCVYPDRIADRMRRGTGAPPLGPGDGLDPIEAPDPIAAHVRRLERLRDLAADAGLAPTAVTAQHAIGRALDFVETAPAVEAEAMEESEALAKPSAAPMAEPAPPPRPDVLPFIRRLIAVDPEMGPVIRDVLAEIRNEPPSLPLASKAADFGIAQAAE